MRHVSILSLLVLSTIFVVDRLSTNPDRERRATSPLKIRDGVHQRHDADCLVYVRQNPAVRSLVTEWQIHLQIVPIEKSVTDVNFGRDPIVQDFPVIGALVQHLRCFKIILHVVYDIYLVIGFLLCIPLRVGAALSAVVRVLCNFVSSVGLWIIITTFYRAYTQSEDTTVASLPPSATIEDVHSPKEQFNNSNLESDSDRQWSQIAGMPSIAEYEGSTGSRDSEDFSDGASTASVVDISDWDYTGDIYDIYNPMIYVGFETRALEPNANHPVRQKLEELGEFYPQTPKRYRTCEPTWSPLMSLDEFRSTPAARRVHKLNFTQPVTPTKLVHYRRATASSLLHIADLITPPRA